MLTAAARKFPCHVETAGAVAAGEAEPPVTGSRSGNSGFFKISFDTEPVWAAAGFTVT